MKNLFLSLVLVMVGLVADSQVITVNVHTIQNFNHTSSMSTVDAMRLDLIEYPSYGSGENIYTFDINKKILTLKNSNGVFTSEIVKVNKNKNTLDCVVFDGEFNTLFLLGETSDGDMIFLMENIFNGRVGGAFSMNSDFDYSVK